MTPPDLTDYVTVPERIAEFRERYPEGCLRPLNPERPYWLEQVGERLFVVYVAVAYRSPTDPLPGIGCAWEPFPGPTNYTRDSELQNAETSAWGRAIVAALAGDTKKGIASTEEVRARTGPAEQPLNTLQNTCPDCHAPVGRVHATRCPQRALSSQ